MSECTDDLREVSRLLLPDRPCSSDVCAEAADYVEALETENKRLKADRIERQKYADKAHAENQRLREALGKLLNDNSPINRDDAYTALQEGE